MINIRFEKIKIVSCFLAVILMNSIGMAQSSAYLDSVSPDRSVHFTTENTYPWTASFTNDGWVAKSGNRNIHNSTSSMYATVIVPSGADADFSFEYKISSQASYDALYVMVDGMALPEFTAGVSGYSDATYHSCTVALTAGTHTVEWYYSKNASTNSGEDAAFIRNVRLSLGYCPRPANVTPLAIGPYSAEFSWNGQSSTGIEYGPQGFARGTGTSDFITDTVYSLIGLQPQTYYTLYLQSYCPNGDTSVWISYTFRTSCEPISSLPYVQDFESWTSSSSISSTIDPCWNRHTNYQSSTMYPYVNTSYSHSGTKSMYFYGYNNNSPYSILVLPPFEDTINSLQVSFWMYSSYTSSNYAIQVGVMTDPNDPSTFVAVAQRNSTVASMWQAFDVPLQYYTGRGKYIALKTATYCYAYIDDITVDTIPGCQRPTNLRVTTTYATQAAITWQGSASSYDVEYGTPGFPRGSGTTVHVTGTNTMLSGLSPNTCYEVYVTSNCANGSHNRSYSLQFRTSCGKISTMPFVENFEGLTASTLSSKLPCWRSYCNYSSSYPSITSYGGSNTVYMYTYSSSVPANYYNYFAIPEIDQNLFPLNTLQVSCRIARPYSSTSYANKVAFGIMTDSSDIETFDTLDIINFGSTSGWVDYTYSLANYNGNGKFIAFKGMTEGTQYYMYFYFDDLVVDKIPTCPKPTELRVHSTYDPDDIRISWKSHPAPARSWDIAYGPTGFSPYIEGVHITDVTDTFYTLSGLSVDTTYDIYVRSNCSAESSMWNTTPVSVTPGTVIVPYLGEETYYLCDAVIYDNGGRMQAYEPSSNGRVTIYPMTTDSVINITGAYSTESGYDYISVYDGANVSGTRLARVSGTGILNCTSTIGPLTLEFTSDVGAEMSGFELHARCVAPPDCRRPIPTVLSVASRQVNVDVISSPANNWITEYRAGTSNFTPGRGTGTTVVTNSSNYFITGLQPQTTYKAYVRTACGGNDTSDWSYAFTFTTPCDPDTVLPVVEDFESYSNNVQISCWSHSSNTYPRTRIWPALSSNKTYILFSQQPNTLSYTAIKKVETSYPLQDLHLKFKLFGIDSASVFKVGIMTNPNDYSTFTQVASFNLPDDYDWHNYDIPLSSYQGQDGYIAFSAINPYRTSSVYIDNLIIDTMQTCAVPTGVTSSQTGNDITLSWNGQGASEWLVQFGRRGFQTGTEPSYYTATPSMTVSRLLFDPNTEYDVYVRSICSAGDTSEWSLNPYRFVPQCDVWTLPHTENFETYIGSPYSNYKRVMPVCWNTVSTDAPTAFYAPQIYEDTVMSLTGRYSLLLNSSSVIATPAIDNPLDSTMVEFFMNVENISTGLVVGIAEDTAFIPFDTLFNTRANEYQLHNVVFNGYTGNSHNIGFRNISTVACDTMRVYIDSLTAMQRPACAGPSHLAVGNVTAHTAHVSWTERGAATSWIIEYDTIGFTLGTGHSITVNTNPYVLTGLDSNLTYEVYVRSICPDGDTSGWITFPTEFTLPRCDESCVYTLNLISPSGGFFDAEILMSYNEIDTLVYGLRTGTSASNTIIACPEEILYFSWKSGRADDRCYFVLLHGEDTLYESGNQTEGLFYTLTCNSNDSCPRPGNLAVSCVDYQTVDASWSGTGNYAVACQQTGTANIIVQDTIRTNNYLNTYRISSLDPDVMYTWRVRNLCYVDSLSDWEVLNFKIADNICVEPINLALDQNSLSHNSAKLRWHSFANNNSWQLRCFSYTSGFDSIYQLNDSVYTLRGLSSGVNYYATVRGVCASSANSVWSDTVAFITDVCDTVSEVSVSQITNNSAVVTWSADNLQTRWEVDYGTQGFPVGYGNTSQTTSKTYRMTGLNPGTVYDVYVRNVCGSDYFSVWSPKVRFKTTGTSSISTVESNGVQMTVTPNPATYSAHIAVEGISGETVFTVTDANGKVRLHETVTCNGTLDRKLDVSGFAKGAYFIHLTNEKTSIVEKLIVQ